MTVRPLEISTSTTDDNEKRKYVNLLAAYGYEIQQNSLTTRVTTTSSTCLDHVISGFPLKLKQLK